MADVKWSALTAVTDLQDTDILSLVRSTANNKITGANLKAQVIAAATNATQAELDAVATASVAKSLYDANTVLAADTDNTPAAVTMGASTILARLAAGNIKAATPAELRTLLDVPTTGEAVLDTLYDANTVLAATSDNTPAALTMGASTILARLASGNIVAASVAEIAALIDQALPGYQFDRAQITSNATSTATVEASATTIITGSSVTYDGAAVRIIVTAEGFNNSVGAGTNTTVINVWRDSTDIGRVALMESTSRAPLYGEIQDTPTAAAHTYSVRMWVINASTGTVTAGAGGAGANSPAVMRVVKV